MRATFWVGFEKRASKYTANRMSCLLQDLEKAAPKLPRDIHESGNLRAMLQGHLDLWGDPQTKHTVNPGTIKRIVDRAERFLKSRQGTITKPDRWNKHNLPNLPKDEVRLIKTIDTTHGQKS